MSTDWFSVALEITKPEPVPVFERDFFTEHLDDGREEEKECT